MMKCKEVIFLGHTHKQPLESLKVYTNVRTLQSNLSKGVWTEHTYDRH